ncbi:arp2/3 complex [Blastocladiella britannica]|nr:arp2/3 complex [Blastocladiella britannica]
MILLDSHHGILLETLQNRLESDHSDSLSVRIADFDGAAYQVGTVADAKHCLTVSLSLRCYPDLLQYGATDVLRTVFGSWLQAQPEQGYDVTLLLDMPAIAADPDAVQRLLTDVPLLKRHAMAAPFLTAFAAQANKETSPIATIRFREGEAIFIQALPDRVTVFFATQFKEETDRIFAKVFLQEFADARRLPTCMNAPSVLYTPRDPPLELRSVPDVPQGDSVGYVTFVLFPKHFADQASKDASISRTLLFRDYLHYHIKCSKAYMHSRMRARVDSFLKVLNRAKPEVVSADKKTASGRTFVRRV